MCGETLCYLSKTRPTEIQVENTDNIIIIYTLLRQTNLRAAFTHGGTWFHPPATDIFGPMRVKPIG